MTAAVEFGRTAHDYARHRAGFPPSLFDRLSRWGVGAPRQPLLDLGTGTGTLARGFAARGARVTALDPDLGMLEQAHQLAVDEGLDIRWIGGTAEDTGLADGAFAVVTAGQCWHWFDGPAAAREVGRLLVPGGRVVIAHFDWIPLAGNLAARTERLIEAFNPAWRMGGGNGVHAAWLPVLGEAGFVGLETASWDVPVPYTAAAWRGRIRASAGVGASLPPERVVRFDAALAQLLAGDYPEDPIEVIHRVWFVTGTRPA